MNVDGDSVSGQFVEDGSGILIEVSSKGWHHLAFTASSQGACLYLDGEQRLCDNVPILI